MNQIPPNPTKRHAIVTGASGYIGSQLVVRLARDGWAVYSLVRNQSTVPAEVCDLSEVLRHDGSTEQMVELLRPIPTDGTVVFHLASCFIAEHQTKDVESLIQSNLLFGCQLLEAMSVNGFRRLINTGTTWQHYHDEQYNPVCLYAATKEAFEALARYYIEARSLQMITLKLSDTYGPGDPRRKLFNFLRQAARQSHPVPMSPGEQGLDLVYIDDVLEAFVLAAGNFGNDARTNEKYVVSSGQAVPLRKVVELYATVTGNTLPIQWGGRPYRQREVMRPWQGGVTVPGWSPRVPLESGMRLLSTT